jgi:hypothetical protein
MFEAVRSSRLTLQFFDLQDATTNKYFVNKMMIECNKIATSCPIIKMPIGFAQPSKQRNQDGRATWQT